MTGYTVHTGASKKFVSGWDRVFGAEPEPSSSKTAAAGKKQKGKAGNSAKGEKQSKAGKPSKKEKKGKKK